MLMKLKISFLGNMIYGWYFVVFLKTSLFERYIYCIAVGIIIVLFIRHYIMMFEEVHTVLGLMYAMLLHMYVGRLDVHIIIQI